MVAHGEAISNPSGPEKLDETPSLRLDVCGGIMQLLPDPSLTLSSGDFNAHVDGKGLNLPSPLFGRLRDCNIHTAEQFVAMCQSAPLSLAMVLDWSLECVEPALKALTATLEGHVSSAILHPGPPVDYKIDEDTLTDEEHALFDNANKAN